MIISHHLLMILTYIQVIEIHTKDIDTMLTPEQVKKYQVLIKAKVFMNV